MKNELQRMGENFRGILNDLKRRPEDAARELGVSVEDIHAIIDGKKELSLSLIQKATEVWPISARDFFLLNDDCPAGVRIMRASTSEKTRRLMDRGGYPYYEYRDTAASSLALFRPEWIQEECFVDDNDPQNPKVQWNNGHFMHQFTYFIGPVNFYYRDAKGEKQVAVMDTGDSMYITPFVPHTFTTRATQNNAQYAQYAQSAQSNQGSKPMKGLILALTYGNKVVGECQQELSALGTELASQYALDFTSKEMAFASLVRFYREGASLTREEIAKRMGKDAAAIASYETGTIIPSGEELTNLAHALGVNTQELVPFDEIEQKVILKKYETGTVWYYPESKAYKLVELAQTKSLPNSKAMECTVLTDSPAAYDFKNGLHQYLYNVGETPVKIFWVKEGKAYEDILNPHDSAYVEPFVPHCFRGKGKLIILRIGGRVVGEAQIELSLLGRGNAKRAIGESLQWFNPQGKKV